MFRFNPFKIAGFILLSLLCGSSFFAQSKKEINAQLKHELTAAGLSYDSIHTQHTNEVGTFGVNVPDFFSKFSRMKVNRHEAQSLAEEITINYRKLITLNIGVPKDEVDMANVRRDLPNYGINELDEKGLTGHFIVQPNIAPLILEGLKMKDQNEQISYKIAAYNNASASMKEELVVIQNLKSTIHIVDSLDLFFDDLLKQYAQKNSVLSAKLKAAEENYSQKGPDGFSSAYEQVFPHFFSKPVNHVNPAPKSNYDSPEKEPAPEIIGVVDEVAQFPGGMDSLKAYIYNNLKYPESAKEKGITGKCYMKFEISASGKISNIRVLKGVPDCAECDAEAIRLIQGMPDWIPAKDNDGSVNSYYTIPIKFAP